jgi:hypothetical protein
MQLTCYLQFKLRNLFVFFLEQNDNFQNQYFEAMGFCKRIENMKFNGSK